MGRRTPKCNPCGCCFCENNTLDGWQLDLDDQTDVTQTVTEPIVEPGADIDPTFTWNSTDVNALLADIRSKSIQFALIDDSASRTRYKYDQTFAWGNSIRLTIADLEGSTEVTYSADTYRIELLMRQNKSTHESAPCVRVFEFLRISVESSVVSPEGFAPQDSQFFDGVTGGYRTGLPGSAAALGQNIGWTFPSYNPAQGLDCFAGYTFSTGVALAPGTEPVGGGVSPLLPFAFNSAVYAAVRYSNDLDFYGGYNWENVYFEHWAARLTGRLNTP